MTVSGSLLPRSATRMIGATAVPSGLQAAGPGCERGDEQRGNGMSYEQHAGRQAGATAALGESEAVDRPGERGKRQHTVT